ncbi:hypothetical protein [Streptomyces fumanus]|uniref:Uncharacterized protein n=1 Tax=Streptomyces fumanus TaxID=67302 RepID=A0A919E9M1_9ACTN|nr:hypothetical protein [Streptomyces fumanus]GHF28033.1 hypothetical protein GCM10018772_62130 [Streptomyces fumanus]
MLWPGTPSTSWRPSGSNGASQATSRLRRLLYLLARHAVLLAWEDAARRLAAADRVEAALDTLKALLGEDVLAVPQYAPSTTLASDWKKARDDSGGLIKHLEDAGRDFPVDDWLHGIARVREKPRLGADGDPERRAAR